MPTPTAPLLRGDARTASYATFPQKAANARANTSYAKASWFSRLVFGYAKPVMDIGHTRQLNEDDLWQLEGENRTSVAYAKYKRAYVRYNKSVYRAILSTYGAPIVFCGLGSFTMAACAIFAPIVLQHVIDAFSAPVLDVEDLAWWLGTFLLSRLVNAFCDAHVNFQTQLWILRLTVSLKSLLFEKTMRRSLQSRNDNGMIDVSNLFTSDMTSIIWASSQINMLWILPIQITVIVYLLYTLLDIAAFAGLGVILLSMGLNTLVARGYMSAFADIMTYKDRRMKDVKEAFGAIQIVKLNAWEDQFFDRIQVWRQLEMKAIAKYLYLMGMITFLFWSAPLAVSATSFVTYAVVLEQELTPAKVFTAMVLFNSIRMPLFSLSNVLQTSAQARISLQRMVTYLNTTDIDESCVSHDAESYEKDTMISIEQADFGWKTSPEAFEVVDEGKAETEQNGIQRLVLRGVDLEIRKGDFVVVHGPVGAGKSSLLAAMLGELPCTNGKVFVRTHKVAYYSQQPWIQNLTIRDNILFGLPFNAKKYERVLDACGLVKDLEQFPAGDKTEIGQKGVNLSGGQKARVSLARACYADADIYILDSPLAAVDAVVQSEIFNKCLCGLLESKTVVLVTHLHDVIESKAVNVKISISSNGTVDVERHERTQKRQQYATVHGEVSLGEQLTEKTIDGEKIVPSGSLVEDEVREDGRVAWDVYMSYLDALGGISFGVFFTLVLISWLAFQVSTDLWLSHWTSMNPTSGHLVSVAYNVTVYSILGVGAALFGLLYSMTLAYAGVKAARTIFDSMTRSLLRAPLRFFDSNPIGRILNRYTEDISTIDFQLSFNYFGVLTYGVKMLMQLATAVYVIKWIGVVFIPLAYVYARLAVYYMNSCREVSRILKVSASPILSHLSQTEEGVAVIRAFGSSYVERAVHENFKRIDGNNRVWYAETLVNQWFSVRIQMIGFAVVLVVVSSLLVLHEYLSPGLVGLAFMYAVNIDEEMSYIVKMWARIEILMVSPERVSEYIGIKPEGRRVTKDVSLIWPQTGSLSFDNVVFAYKPGGDPVLKGLSFSIQHNEKIGIVGRTGAGKSSLTMALFRINELESGRIIIDGQDISAVNLQALRSRMSIIPQVPVLFKGSMRAYMDPFGEYDDADIWQAFDKIGLKDMISALDGKLNHELSENGENFSVGERQMLCLARALLRRSRVVVMDEATASIDLATEQKLQAMIQREFVDATVLTIAHRLATVLDSDRILVLSDGRVVEFDTPKRLARLEGGVFRELAQEGGYLQRLLA
ncbi:hypothetical protein Poli38472_001281 [Pythium oligandrum]|uniref:Uncharacterized protein n=1 Tax=Pythium oligandrum TaxID=41045 RepID=A0A8K1CUW8_PYTOL|nr:hypothetical protein Poli38472_001281 [Pythium oligandrum]|eukprot:TMW69125.1 hypothetical protein Poli38472_001281 [Pythium oligandrum]